MSSRTLLRRVLLTAASLVWAGAILLGGRTLLTYENSAGAPGASPASWPPDSHIQRDRLRFTLVMLAHPDCPCSRASVTELEQIVARSQAHSQEKLAAHVLFSKPGAGAAEIGSSDLWKQASRIPGVTVRHDVSGVETTRFGGRVSGQTMLYDPAGKLVFSGGITRARGHQGNSSGEEAILAALRGDRAEFRETPVFGCSLHDPTNKQLREEPRWRTD
jgi:hypothetical protein